MSEEWHVPNIYASHQFPYVFTHILFPLVGIHDTVAPLKLASHNQRASEGANYCSSFLTALPASFGHPPERVVDVPCSVGLVMQIYENCNEK
jgi:hypothetical protein